MATLLPRLQLERASKCGDESTVSGLPKKIVYKNRKGKKIMSLKFVGLHAHSHFSIGDAVGTPEEHYDFVIKNAGEDSFSLALSDHGNANGFGYILDAQNKFKKKGIPFKPIYGVELYIHPDLDQWKIDKEKAKAEKEEETSELVVEDEQESKSKWFDPVKRRHHLVVLVQNYEG